VPTEVEVFVPVIVSCISASSVSVIVSTSGELSFGNRMLTRLAAFVV
jgi:hypothetical protein